MRLSIEWNSTYDCADVIVSFYAGESIIAQSSATKNTQKVEFDADAPAVEHAIKIKIHGKTQEHTDPDLLINIEKVQIEDIDFTQRFYELADYTHDFNGNNVAVTQKFYRSLGCNGTVTMGYSAPICLWLLDYL